MWPRTTADLAASRAISVFDCPAALRRRGLRRRRPRTLRCRRTSAAAATRDAGLRARRLRGRSDQSRGSTTAASTYSINAMAWGTAELEPEVRDWLEDLSTRHFARAACYIDLLAERRPLLDEPYTRQLDGSLRELRFHLDRAAMRITYWIATQPRIILLAVFRKTQMRADRQVERARRAVARCIAEAHTVEEEV
jgi:phage-related protein